ncbi:hypothetical protein [Hyalangium versicolor]|uniref:hypothetical protein n=1 Tax=Hyalangium versicolor TaxID=2861190 RepID=UPI001CCC432A|nr:hypothetical protein [Hyalangium versicolor]
MKYLTTVISLPPGVAPRPTLHTVLELIFEQYRWFRPERYGLAKLDERLVPGRIDYAALLALYERLASITIAARTDRDFLRITVTRPGDHPHAGNISWMTSMRTAASPGWRAAHSKQVAELMRLMQAPMAAAGPADDFESKQSRWVPHPDGLGEALTFTVRDPSEGLAGLFWRNFFGPPFVHLFGERLDTLPAELKQDLGDGVILVQPYELPTQAGTPEALSQEQQLIAHLGSDCFYDHPHHRKPTRLPQLPSPPP